MAAVADRIAQPSKRAHQRIIGEISGFDQARVFRRCVVRGVQYGAGQIFVSGKDPFEGVTDERFPAGILAALGEQKLDDPAAARDVSTKSVTPICATSSARWNGVNTMHLCLNVPAVALALLVTAQSSSAQPIPFIAPNALEAQLRVDGIDTAPGSGKRQALNCIRGSARNDWAYHCVATLVDAARGGRSAAVEIMIFNDGYDFASRDAQIKALVTRLNGRWSLEYTPEIGINGEGQKISLKGACHQSRGRANSPAYCLLPVARNVLIFSQVAPAESSSDEITTSQNGESDSFDDMAHAGTLASLGAIAVVKAQRGTDKINNASDSLIR